MERRLILDFLKNRSLIIRTTSTTTTAAMTSPTAIERCRSSVAIQEKL
jgi:hypothetical protein